MAIREPFPIATGPPESLVVRETDQDAVFGYLAGVFTMVDQTDQDPTCRLRTKDRMFEDHEWEGSGTHEL
jgi:hypothetical protein